MTIADHGLRAIPEVRTDRLLLRAVRHDDLDLYHTRIFADPEGCGVCLVAGRCPGSGEPPLPVSSAPDSYAWRAM